MAEVYDKTRKKNEKRQSQHNHLYNSWNFRALSFTFNCFCLFICVTKYDYLGLAFSSYQIKEVTSGQNRINLFSTYVVYSKSHDDSLLLCWVCLTWQTSVCHLHVQLCQGGFIDLCCKTNQATHPPRCLQKEILMTLKGIFQELAVSAQPSLSAAVRVRSLAVENGVGVQNTFSSPYPHWMVLGRLYALSLAVKNMIRNSINL